MKKSKFEGQRRGFAIADNPDMRGWCALGGEVQGCVVLLVVLFEKFVLLRGLEPDFHGTKPICYQLSYAGLDQGGYVIKSKSILLGPTVLAKAPVPKNNLY